MGHQRRDLTVHAPSSMGAHWAWSSSRAATCTDRLLHRDPDGSVGWSAPVSPSPPAGDESYVAVAECRGRAVVRLWPGGPRADGRDHLVTDPVARRTPRVGADGAAARGPAHPGRELGPRPARTIRVQAYDDEGALVHAIEPDPPGAVLDRA